MKYDITITKIIRDAWNNGTFDRIRELYKTHASAASPKIPSIYDIENLVKTLLWRSLEEKTVCESGIRVDLIQNGEMHEFRLSYQIDLISASNYNFTFDKPIKIVDARNNVYDIVSITNDENNTFIKIDNKLSNGLSGFININQYGIDEHPLTDEWANKVMKHKNIIMDCGND